MKFMVTTDETVPGGTHSRRRQVLLSDFPKTVFNDGSQTKTQSTIFGGQFPLTVLVCGRRSVSERADVAENLSGS